MDMGAVPEWNDQNPLEKVTTGTRILEAPNPTPLKPLTVAPKKKWCQVNGISGNVHRMYEQLRKEGVIELVVPWTAVGHLAYQSGETWGGVTWSWNCQSKGAEKNTVSSKIRMILVESCCRTVLWKSTYFKVMAQLLGAGSWRLVSKEPWAAMRHSSQLALSDLRPIPAKKMGL